MKYIYLLMSLLIVNNIYSQDAIKISYNKDLKQYNLTLLEGGIVDGYANSYWVKGSQNSIDVLNGNGFLKFVFDESFKIHEVGYEYIFTNNGKKYVGGFKTNNCIFGLKSYFYNKQASSISNLFEYEKLKPTNNIPNSIEWSGNGSGFFIDEEGYIITNFHVIKNAKLIGVEFKYNQEILTFNAKVIKSDKINDLAVLKIDDSKFNKINTIPYNLKTRPIDIASEVYALGYPLALSIMGKDIKFTSGRISSKTGIDGDITNYQIQVPIQPGNSGGPLFDMEGNLVGVTTSSVNRTLDLTENVNYAVKSSYIVNLVDVLSEKINLPSSTKLSSLSLTQQIKLLEQYVVLVKVK